MKHTRCHMNGRQRGVERCGNDRFCKHIYIDCVEIYERYDLNMRLIARFKTAEEAEDFLANKMEKLRGPHLFCIGECETCMSK